MLQPGGALHQMRHRRPLLPQPDQAPPPARQRVAVLRHPDLADAATRRCGPSTGATAATPLPPRDGGPVPDHDGQDNGRALRPRD
jgi:hypothetical protein